MGFNDDVWEREPHETAEAKAANGAVLRVGFQGSYTQASYGYDVELLSGDWPPDQELISLCHSFFAAEFGGRIEPSPAAGRKRVVVYTD